MTINLNGTTGITTTGLTSNGIDDNATSTAMTLDTSGNLLVGKTSTGYNSGTEISYEDFIRVNRTNGSALYVGRNSSDGELVSFRQNSSTVGSIGTAGGTLTIDGGGTSSGIYFGENQLVPRDNGAGSNNVVDLGQSGNSFKDLYLSGGVYLGGTGSANKLDDYEEGTWTPTVTTGFTSPSYSIQVGYYTKIGNVVRAYYRLLLNGGTAVGTGVIFSGLPFTASNLGSLFPTGTHYINAAIAGGENSKLLVFPNTNSIYLYSQDETGVSGVNGTTVGNSLDILGQVIYQTDA